MPQIADVIINRPATQLHKPFSYTVPDDFGTIPIGTRVYVPLGKGKEEGIIIGYRGQSEHTLKPIISILDDTPWFTEEMLATGKAISKYYITPYSSALRLFTIDKKEVKGYSRPVVRWLEINLKESFSDLHRKKRQKALRNLIQSVGSLSVIDAKKLGFSKDIIERVSALPEITVTNRFAETHSSYDKISYVNPVPLTDAQIRCFTPIEEAIHKTLHKTFLLHGVTGSGKTQIYIKSVQACLEKGKSAIVLVPEIVLTHQIVERFIAVFGDEVVVFHSKITKSERYNNWERLRRGDSHIIIGARSAIFAPLSNIGLIVIDEEHDTSYKQEDMTRYDARKVAQIRSAYFNCPVLLGSATPSVTSFYKALQGTYELLELKERIHQQPLPQITLADMKEELFFGNYSVFSQAMTSLVTETLEKKEQMIMLLNRRGFATFVICRQCGASVQCPHCDTAMIYHKANEQLRCHYCEYKETVPKECPKCGSKKIKFFGSGTQKVESLLQTTFPKARIARLDQDVTQEKNAAHDILEAFKEGNYDILLGTQMVSKGHDFPNVTAVGVVTADSLLHLPSYTASERTFSLLTQTAGRAGRGDKKGKVVIQTYDPSHYAIIASKNHDYKAFYKEEISYRESLKYPPFGEMIHIVCRHKYSSKAFEIASRAVGELQNFVTMLDGEKIEILGPYEEYIYRVRDVYRMSLMIRGNRLDKIKEYIYNSWMFTQEGIIIDVDPL